MLTLSGVVILLTLTLSRGEVHERPLGHWEGGFSALLRMLIPKEMVGWRLYVVFSQPVQSIKFWTANVTKLSDYEFIFENMDFNSVEHQGDTLHLSFNGVTAGDLWPEICAYFEGVDPPSVCPVPGQTFPPTSSPTVPTSTDTPQSTPEPSTTSNPTSEPTPESTTTSEPTTTPELTTESITTTPEPTTEPITTTPEPTTEPITTTPEPTTEPITTTPEPTTEPITTTPQPTTEPITTTPEPTTEPITTTPEPTTEPITATPEPITPEPINTTTPKPASTTTQEPTTPTPQYTTTPASGTSGSTTSSSCVDDSEMNCWNRPESDCHGIYEPWARSHCPQRCGYCQGSESVCVDRIAGCDKLIADCTNPTYSLWARTDCRKTCGQCPTLTHTTAVSVYPNDCDFEGHCTWTNSTAGDTKMNWIHFHGTTPTGNTGPSGDHTTGFGYYLYIETSTGATGDNARLVSPELLANQEYCLTFWYHLYGASLGNVNVRTRSGGVTGDPILTYNGPNEDKWKQGSVQLPAQPTPFQFIIEGVRGNGYLGDAAIDDIQVREAPCSS